MRCGRAIFQGRPSSKANNETAASWQESGHRQLRKRTLGALIALIGRPDNVKNDAHRTRK